MTKLLTKVEILEAKDLVFEDVEAPEWGGMVRVKGMTGAERNAYEQSVLVQSGDTYRANLALAKEKLLVITLVDEDGQRLFGDAELKALAGKNAAVIDRLFMVASRLSGISDDDIDELAKNSEAAQNGSSGSD
jgi:hypothetical protein